MVSTRTDLYGRAVAAGFPEHVADALSSAACDGDVLNARRIAATQTMYPAHNVPADRLARACLRWLGIRHKYHPADVSAVLCRSQEAAALSVALDQVLYGHEPLGAIEVSADMARVARIPRGTIPVVSCLPILREHGWEATDPELPDNHWAADQIRPRVQGPFADLRQPGTGGLLLPPGVTL